MGFFFLLKFHCFGTTTSEIVKDLISERKFFAWERGGRWVFACDINMRLTIHNNSVVKPQQRTRCVGRARPSQVIAFSWLQTLQFLFTLSLFEMVSRFHNRAAWIMLSIFIQYILSLSLSFHNHHHSFAYHNRNIEIANICIFSSFCLWYLCQWCRRRRRRRRCLWCYHYHCFRRRRCRHRRCCLFAAHIDNRLFLMSLPKIDF